MEGLECRVKEALLSLYLHYYFELVLHISAVVFYGAGDRVTTPRGSLVYDRAKTANIGEEWRGRWKRIFFQAIVNLGIELSNQKKC
jgi:hypothetical protein